MTTTALKNKQSQKDTKSQVKIEDKPKMKIRLQVTQITWALIPLVKEIFKELNPRSVFREPKLFYPQRN
jgi:hypothetical protein